jgi:hypothetical protein
MPKRDKKQWRPWHKDARVSVAHDDGGIWVRVPDADAGYRESTWCLLIGSSEDVTVRCLLHEIGYTKAAAIA